jgi:hypothetical protein
MFLQIALMTVVVGHASDGPSLGAEDPEVLIREGNQLRQQGEDVRAEGYFRRAYQVAKTGRTAGQLGLVELAIGAYLLSERYLSESLNSDDAWVRSNAETLEKSRASARSKLVQLEVVGIPDDTSATEGHAPSVRVRANGPLWIDAGMSSVRFDAPGHRPTTVQVEGHAGEVRRITVLLLPERPESVSADIADERLNRRDAVGTTRVQRTAVATWLPIASGVLGLSAAIAGSILYPLCQRE